MNDEEDQKPRRPGGQGGHYGYHGHHHHGGGATVGSHDVVDPVCGATLDPHMTRHYLDQEGGRIFFCSAECKTRFENAPVRSDEAENIQEPDKRPA